MFKTVREPTNYGSSSSTNSYRDRNPIPAAAPSNPPQAAPPPTLAAAPQSNAPTASASSRSDNLGPAGSPQPQSLDAKSASTPLISPGAKANVSVKAAAIGTSTVSDAAVAVMSGNLLGMVDVVMKGYDKLQKSAAKPNATSQYGTVKTFYAGSQEGAAAGTKTPINASAGAAPVPVSFNPFASR